MNDRYGDLEAALRTAVKAINKATIRGHEAEMTAEEGCPPDEAEFAAIYRALRVARRHVHLVTRTYLKDLRKQDARQESSRLGSAKLQIVKGGAT